MSYRNDGRTGNRPASRAVPAPYALPAGCAALLVVGATAAATHGWLSSGWVLAMAAVIVAGVGAAAEPGTALFMVGAGWLTAAGFSGPPYAQLRLGWHSGARAALVLSLAALAGIGIGWLVRRIAASFTLRFVDVSHDARFASLAAEPQLTGSPAQSAVQGEDVARAPAHPRHWLPALAPSGGLARRRQLTGVLLVAILPLLTVALAPAQHSISLSDDLLIFLVCVVSVAVVGGFWPAVLAAVTASLLLNWFFTPPVHTFTIADPQNILALLLFITVAVTVSSVVHLAARRAVQAARSRADAAALLALAQTVLGGDDTPAAILDHLTGTRGGRGELTERAGEQWVTVACSGSADAGAQTTRVPAGADLLLEVSGQREPLTPGLLDGFAAQAAAALERDRLRTQAAQAEALAEGNRMRTALLAAVSHDLRTPLSSIKASISTLRQPAVQLPADDEGALLATIEESADRLNALIGNLLDMSRLSTGSLEPLLRPTSIDEVAPLAQRDADSPVSLEIQVPDDLPLVRTDPGLLERVLANLFANAVAHSPAGSPPVMFARQDGDAVLLDVVDHGCGVPDDLKERIFEPFERLSERNTGTGVGLGLAVAHGFLSAMGGTIAALDTPGGGLTMRVTLPAAAAAAPSGRTGEQ
jgi:two-component system, OmpR family, sensor histidine kinase KdpD